MPDHRDLRAGAAAVTAPGDAAERVRALHSGPRVEAMVQLFRRERKWIDERHLEICRIPALTFREQERAEAICELFADLGLKAQIDEAGNVAAPIVFTRGAPFTAVTAHLDTAIAPGGRHEVSVDPDGTMRGPGVTDNGVGLAALIALARGFELGPLAARPRRNVLLVANVAEEGEGNLLGIKHLCSQSRFAKKIAEYVVIDGASTGHITVEALGSRRFEISIEGRGGHSWNDYGRANPVHAMARAAALLSDVELPRSPRATMTVATIEGGSGVNAIASSARAKIDIRSRSSQGIDQVVQAMEDAVRLAVERENRRATDRLSGYRIREIGHRPAAVRAPDNWMADCLQAVDACLGLRSRFDCASTDANVPLAAGIPAVAIGAGGRGGDAHSPTEWYHPEGRAQGLERIALALAALQAGAFG